MVSKWCPTRTDWIIILTQAQKDGFRKEIPRNTLIQRVSNYYDIIDVKKILRMIKDADELGLVKVTSPSTFEITARELVGKDE